MPLLNVKWNFKNNLLRSEWMGINLKAWPKCKNVFIIGTVFSVLFFYVETKRDGFNKESNAGPLFFCKSGPEHF